MRDLGIAGEWWAAAIGADTGSIVSVRLLYDAVFMASNIPEMIVMIRHIHLVESRTVLRTMLIADAPAAGNRVEAA